MHQLVPNRRPIRILSGASLSLAALLSGLLVACGGGSSGSSSTTTPTPTPTPAAKTSVQINMGDSPANWMLAFSMNVSSMSLTGSNGSVAVVSTTVPMEMMHLMGTMQPMAMASVPQGTWTGASVTIASATLTYLDPNTRTPAQQVISGPISANMTFASPVTVGTTPMAMSFDLDLGKSISGTSGSFTMNPVFNVASAAQGSGNPMDYSDGGIQHMMGSLSGASGSSFSMTSMQAAQSFTFATNSSTVFDGTSMSGMAGSMGNMMGSGMLLMVDATLQQDGSLLATHVQSMMGAGGAMGGGVITALTGSPATQLTMIMQNGVGAGMMASYFADGVTIALNGSTSYDIDDDNIDMSSLPFSPVFDAGHIHLGQSVMPISSGGMMSGGGMMGGMSLAGSITAAKMELEPQGLTGTVSAAVTSGSATTLTLTLPTDCAFTTLTGASTVTLYQRSKTIVFPTSSIAQGATVHAFGLLFFDGGQWKMVISRISSN